MEIWTIWAKLWFFGQIEEIAIRMMGKFHSVFEVENTKLLNFGHKKFRNNDIKSVKVILNLINTKNTSGMWEKLLKYFVDKLV